MPLYHKSVASRTQLSLFHRSLLQSVGGPFRPLLSDQRIAEIFRDEGIVFGEDEEAVYTPLITLWGLLSQVFFKDEQRRCVASYECHPRLERPSAGTPPEPSVGPEGQSPLRT